MRPTRKYVISTEWDGCFGKGAPVHFFLCDYTAEQIKYIYSYPPSSHAKSIFRILANILLMVIFVWTLII